MDETLIRGDMVELQCIQDFQKRGYYCSIPFSGSCRYDVVVDINDVLYKIQCKSSTYHEEGVLHMDATRSTTNTKKTTRYTYSKNEVDYFYTCYNNYSFLIPIEEISTSKYLRLKKPKTGIQSTMSIGNDYLLDNVLDAILNNNGKIKHYQDHCIISIENQKEWSSDELMKKYSQRQINYIRESISKKKLAYGYHWMFKEFPEL
jgi:hypothetical protein